MRVFALCLAVLAGLLLQGAGFAASGAPARPAPCPTSTGLHHHSPDDSACEHAAALPGAAGQMAKAPMRLAPHDATLPPVAPLSQIAVAPFFSRTRWAGAQTAIFDPPQITVIRVTRLLI